MIIYTIINYAIVSQVFLRFSIDSTASPVIAHPTVFILLSQLVYLDLNYGFN